MPDYLKRTGRDVTEDTTIRIPEAEKKISRTIGPASKRLSIDRGSIPHVAAPFEGQMMIQYDDEAVGSTPVAPDVGSTFIGENVYYFSNGEWRTFFLSSGLNPGQGTYKDASLTVPAGFANAVPASFTLVSGGILDLTTPTAPTALVRGVYDISVDVAPSSGWTPDMRLGCAIFFAVTPFVGANAEQRADSSGDMAAIHVSCPQLLNAGQGFWIELFNEDSIDHDVTVDPIVVVRIYQY